jgi:CBS domain-containing protein
MQAKEIMSFVVKTIPATATLQEAAEKMRDLDIGILPVQTNTRLVGILTDRDIVTRGLAWKRDPATTLVSEIMTRHVAYCYTEDDIGNVAEKMKRRGVRRLVVFDRAKIAVGIVSLDDLASASSDLSADVLMGVSVCSTHRAKGNVLAIFEELAEPID